MVTFTIRGVHLAIAGAFLAGILIAAGAVFALGGDDGKQSEPPQQVSAANLDVAPTSAPTTAPSATPAPSPTPAPPATPQIRTCGEIRATGTYNSDEERAFFLANCVNQPAAGGGAASNPPASSGSSAQATAEEANYRTKAEAGITVMASRVAVFEATLNVGPAGSKLYEFGSLLRVFAAELDRLPPAPPRFAAVHNALKSGLLKMADFVVTIESSLSSQAAFEKWLDTYIELGNAMQGALEDYSLVVGIPLPTIFTGE